MFKMSYNLKHHATKPGVVYLSPTKTAYVKAFAPWAVVFLTWGAMNAYAKYEARALEIELKNLEEKYPSK